MGEGGQLSKWIKLGFPYKLLSVTGLPGKNVSLWEHKEIHYTVVG